MVQLCSPVKDLIPANLDVPGVTGNFNISGLVPAGVMRVNT